MLKISDCVEAWRVADIWNGRVIKRAFDALRLRTTVSSDQQCERDFDWHQSMVVLPGVVVDNIILELGDGGYCRIFTRIKLARYHQVQSNNERGNQREQALHESDIRCFSGMSAHLCYQLRHGAILDLLIGLSKATRKYSWRSIS